MPVHAAVRRPWRHRAVGLLAGAWAGLLLCIGGVAAPAAFAVLQRADAGRLTGRLFEREAVLSLAIAVLLLLLLRSLHSDLADGSGPSPGALPPDGEARRAGTVTAELLLVFGALFCTVAGYYAVAPMLDSARQGNGPLSFGQLHAISGSFYALKCGLVLALAWRSA